MIALYFIVVVVCFVAAHALTKTNLYSKLEHKPPVRLVFIICLLSPVIITLLLLYCLYVYIAYKRNSK
jgi:hypothetical protein